MWDSPHRQVLIEIGKKTDSYGQLFLYIYYLTLFGNFSLFTHTFQIYKYVYLAMIIDNILQQLYFEVKSAKPTCR